MKIIFLNYASSILKKLIIKIHNIMVASAIILWLMGTVFLLGMLYLVGIEGRDALEQLFFGH